LQGPKAQVNQVFGHITGPVRVSIPGALVPGGWVSAGRSDDILPWAACAYPR
jgi:hypothetical protein